MTSTTVRTAFAGAAVLAWVAIASPTASAQTSLQIPVQFDFVNPGAKSLALGGAFAGVADDATASWANPAGLTLLVTPEVSGEFRFSRITSLSMEGGRLSGTATNLESDVTQGAVFIENVGSRFGARYVSAVYPHPSHQWVVAAYRHELARVNQQVDQERISSNGVFQQDPSETISRREAPFSAGRALKITGYGASGSYKVHQNVAIGVGLTAYRFSLLSEVDQYITTGFYGFTDFDLDPIRLMKQEGTDVAIAPTVGLIVDRGPARLGVVYRRGASFAFNTQDGDDGTAVRNGRFRVPHTLGIGMSVRVTPRLLVAAEATRIEYSRLVDDFVTDQARASGQQASFGIDDGTELHVGAQYALPRENKAPLRLRVGAWYDPDHSVKFRPARTPMTTGDRLFDERFSAALSKGDGADVHLSTGVGFTLMRRLEFNAAADLSQRMRQFSASAILHLGREVLP